MRLICAILGFLMFSVDQVSAAPSWWDSTLTFSNSSQFEIAHIYLSPEDEDDWGPDQLGKDVLGSGDKVEFSGIDCDTYDVKLIDEDGDECVLSDIDLCLEDQEFEITDAALVACQWLS